MEPLKGKANDMSKSNNVSTKQQRIAKLAKEAPDMAMNLSHYIDLEWMEQAYRETRKDGAVGVDGQTAEAYAEHLQENLQDLINRVKSGRYRAPAVKRVQIPKGGSRTETRPIGIPTFEDKLLQRAAKMALEPVYEQDFLECSYGFRPGRSCHQALDVLWKGLMDMGGAHLIDLDIRKYYDTIDHRQVQQIFRQRVRDGVLRRLIGKWLNAGVMEEDKLSYPGEGVPQGGVVSPLLSNIYLHEVLDTWFKEEVQPRLKGRAFMVRYADDAIVACEREEDVKRVMAVLPKRFARYGLTLHPEKTQVVDFKSKPRKGHKGEGPRTVNFLGFTHYWARSRRGKLVIKTKTAKDRLSQAVGRVGQWLRNVRHWPIGEQHKVLCKKIRGHHQYYGRTGNGAALAQFNQAVQRHWLKWLGRRSQKAKRTWKWFEGILKRFPLPKPTPVHSRFVTQRTHDLRSQLR